MGLFRNSIRKLVVWAMNDHEKSYEESESEQIVTLGTRVNSSKKLRLINHRPEFHNDPDLHFRIYMAQGGYILQFSSYDEVKDRVSERLHIIPDTEDLGTNISQIVTVELLRR